MRSHRTGPAQRRAVHGSLISDLRHRLVIRCFVIRYFAATVGRPSGTACHYPSFTASTKCDSTRENKGVASNSDGRACATQAFACRFHQTGTLRFSMFTVFEAEKGG